MGRNQSMFVGNLTCPCCKHVMYNFEGGIIACKNQFCILMLKPYKRPVFELEEADVKLATEVFLNVMRMNLKEEKAS